jgi:hypothetical protein
MVTEIEELPYVICNGVQVPVDARVLEASGFQWGQEVTQTQLADMILHTFLDMLNHIEALDALAVSRHCTLH